jgi:hypothetical protein
MLNPMLKRVFLVNLIFTLSLASCSNIEKEVVSKKTKIKNVIPESVILPSKSWVDSLAEYTIYDYALIFDSSILRNNNSKKMFLAQPSYKRSRSKKWKSLISYSDSTNYMRYQTTNETDQGKGDYYSRSSTKDTVTELRYWKKNDSVNFLFYGRTLVQYAIDQISISTQIFEHSKDGFIDKTDDYLPKIAFRHFLDRPLKSTTLTKPKFVPIIYSIGTKEPVTLIALFNEEYFKDKGNEELEQEFLDNIDGIENFKRHDYFFPLIRFEFREGVFVKLPSDRTE